MAVAGDRTVVFHTRSIDEQNEIPSHGTTLNDSNNDNLVTPPVDPLQGMQLV
ncbi:hypothetical protein A2U01_0105835, partial [Trifolium medium]|nr:hypothetical protein [Trifolium medium]